MSESSGRSRIVTTTVVALCAVPGLLYAALSLYFEAFHVFTPEGDSTQQFFGGAVMALVFMATAALAPIGGILLSAGAVLRWVSIARAGLLALLLAPSLWAILELLGPMLAELLAPMPAPVGR